ncbi:MAG: hypothetical protein SFU20_03190 [Chitinophagaceae bacterium]|nr:hypothetical protein [Chitinophagaceae bacterium]
MKKIIVAAAIFLTISVTRSSAQDYTTALGVKFWDGGGITLKHFFNEQNAGELIGYFWSQGARFTGLYEIHGDISNAGGLRWYIGPGAHVGFYNSKYGDGAYFGVDGVLGLDYKFNNAPINLSIDWQPSIEFGSGRGFYGGWGGLGVRYTFGN